MGCWRIRRLLEMTTYPLLRSIKMLFQQVQFHELIDWPQTFWRELAGFFKCLACFVISFGLTQGQTECHLGLWIARGKPRLLASDYSGIIEAIKRAICSGQKQCGGS